MKYTPGDQVTAPGPGGFTFELIITEADNDTGWVNTRIIGSETTLIYGNHPHAIGSLNDLAPVRS
jgi:hypothetical protein